MTQHRSEIPFNLVFRCSILISSPYILLIWVERNHKRRIRSLVPPTTPMMKKRDVHHMKIMTSTSTPRGPSLKILQLVLKALVMVLVANLFPRSNAPMPLVQGPSVQAPGMREDTIMTTLISLLLNMCWFRPPILTALGVTALW